MWNHASHVGLLIFVSKSKIGITESSLCAQCFLRRFEGFGLSLTKAVKAHFQNRIRLGNQYSLHRELVITASGVLRDRIGH